MALRNAIGYWRERRRLSQRELGERVGKTQPEVSKLEGGDSIPDTIAEVETLARALEVTVADLYADEVLALITANEKVA